MSDLAVLGMYFVGIANGVFLAIWWLTFGAQVRRQAWDNYAYIHDKVTGGNNE